MEKQYLDSDYTLWEPLEPKCEERLCQKPERRHSYVKIFVTRFFKNKLAIVGLCVLMMISILAIVGPILSSKTYDKTNLELVNLPAYFDMYQVENGKYVFIHPDYYLIQVKENGEIIKRLKAKKIDQEKCNGIYELSGHELVVDYGHYARAQKRGKRDNTKVTLSCDGKNLSVYKKSINRTYIFGTDVLGRDMFARTIYSARNSLIIAITATLINTLIGVFLGSLAGYSLSLIHISEPTRPY